MCRLGASLAGGRQKKNETERTQDYAYLVKEHFRIEGHSIVEDPAKAARMRVQFLLRHTPVTFNRQHQSSPERPGQASAHAVGCTERPRAGTRR